MKAPIQMVMAGRSSCGCDEEWSRPFQPYFTGSFLVAYDYRTKDGILFSCIGKSLEDCRAKRDAWIAKQN